MFGKLKLKLILANTILMILLFFMIAGGILFLVNKEISWQSAQVMQLILSDAQGNTRNTARNPIWQNSRYFYVKTGGSHEIIEVFPKDSLDPVQVKLLVEKAFQEGATEGETHFLGKTFHFFKQPMLKNSQEYVFVFENTGQKEELLNFLLLALIVVGLISLILAFFGGKYLARIAMEPVHESWQKQKEFVANASHELRTPLSVIQTNLEVVRGNPRETVESQNIWLDNIQAESSRMTGLVNDLLFLARADSEQKMTAMKKFPLHQALIDSLKPLQAVAEKKNIQLDIQAATPVIYTGDETKIKQLAVILVDNGLRYTPSGGSVTVKIADNGSYVTIMVSDTGVGMEKEHLGKIFQRFYRVERSRADDERGSGLGLAIAQWIVKNHFGKINVQSVKGKGTTFQVVLPKWKPMFRNSK